MGTEIAFAVIKAFTCPVYIVDVNEASLATSQNKIARMLDKEVEKGRLAPELKAGIINRITYTTSMNDLNGTDFVIEAVFEDLGLKQSIFQELNKVCSPAAILATNTSGLSITKIASVVSDPQRVVGTHFFSPASVMKLVEMVQGAQTSEDTMLKTRMICEKMGKEVIVVKDYPGFLTTRVAAAMWTEAARCLQEGVASVEDIDKGMRLAFNHPMGPLETADFVGLEICEHIFDYLAQEYGDHFRPTPMMKQMINAGWFGRKSGKGFYNY